MTTAEPAVPQPESVPGSARAEAGFVVLDGPGRVALTMTVDAARGTGESLIAAARSAEQHSADRKGHDDA